MSMFLFEVLLDVWRFFCRILGVILGIDLRFVMCWGIVLGLGFCAGWVVLF